MAPNQALERTVTTASQLHEASVPVAQRRALAPKARKEDTHKTISPYRRRWHDDDIRWFCWPWEYGHTYGAELAQGRLRAPRL